MESAGQITLILHFIGLALIGAMQVAGFVVNNQYKKAPDLQTKFVLLKVLKPIGLLSPVAILLMLITGIGNMHAFQYSFSEFGWLRTKVVVFAGVSILGIIMGIISKKRGALVGKMLQGGAAADAETTLKKYDKQINTLSMIMPLLLLYILYLSAYGRLGGQ